jgi:diadenosine tetraphosphate (Ap4A) HIT family hydrolase/acetyltransferase-like isoleucine patch superfamily enzyme
MHKLNILDCPFCSRDVSSRLFLSSKYGFSILARHGVEPGQSLVMPRRHVATIEELNPHEVADLMWLVTESIRVLRANGIAKDLNIAINLGSLAGQSVEHLHVHIIPRFAGDTLEPKRWLSEDLFIKLREKSDDELEALSKKLRVAGLSPVQNASELGGEVSLREDFDRGKYIKYDRDINGIEGINYSDMNISIGGGALIRSGSIIYRDVFVGGNFECGHNALIRGGCRIGENVCVYTGAQIQKDVSIGSGCVIGGWVGNGSVIGNDVKMFGELVHKYKSSGRGEAESAPEIMDGAFIGWNAIVVGGVRVGRRAVVGAGSVVVSDVPDDCVVAGNPAKPIN